MYNREFMIEKLRKLRQIVEFYENANLLDLVGLNLFLEDQFGQKVDVVSKRTIKEELRDSILKEAVNL